jgi:hypothetical protein
METPGLYPPGITPEFYSRRREVWSQSCTIGAMALLFILAFVTAVFLTKECEEYYVGYRYTHCQKPMAEAVRAYEKCMGAAREAVPSCFFLG